MWYTAALRMLKKQAIARRKTLGQLGIYQFSLVLNQLVCTGAFSTRCLAQLTLINPSDHAVSLALGFYVEKGLWKGWNTKGWLNVAPHDSMTLLPEGIGGGAFCFAGRVAECDQVYSGTYPLFVHPTDAFSIAGAASEVPVTLNKGVQKVGFAKVELPAGQRRYRLRLPAGNFTQKGIRTGDWLVYLDRDKEEVAKPEQAAYLRRISYQQGVPMGLVRDYYWPANTLQWDGKLLTEHPATKQGTCITYDEAGRKREEALYQNGRVSGSVRRWNEASQEVVTRKRYRTVRVLEPQTGYLVSYFNPGSSRAVIPVQLPANTVSWFYEFTAYRDQAQLQAARARSAQPRAALRHQLRPRSGGGGGGRRVGRDRCRPGQPPAPLSRADQDACRVAGEQPAKLTGWLSAPRDKSKTVSTPQM
nr:hypothetical protein [Tanacetum cinerariifolium]